MGANGHDIIPHWVRYMALTLLVVTARQLLAPAYMENVPFTTWQRADLYTCFL